MNLSNIYYIKDKNKNKDSNSISNVMDLLKSELKKENIDYHNYIIVNEKFNDEKEVLLRYFLFKYNGKNYLNKDNGFYKIVNGELKNINYFTLPELKLCLDEDDSKNIIRIKRYIKNLKDFFSVCDYINTDNEFEY